MSKFWSDIVGRLDPYVPGEQPQDQHLALIDAIEAGHAEAARTAMRDHLETRFTALRGELNNAASEQGEAFFASTTKT